MTLEGGVSDRLLHTRPLEKSRHLLENCKFYEFRLPYFPVKVNILSFISPLIIFNTLSGVNYLKVRSHFVLLRPLAQRD